jgi:hypothetical protein
LCLLQGARGRDWRHGPVGNVRLSAFSVGVLGVPYAVKRRARFARFAFCAYSSAV